MSSSVGSSYTSSSVAFRWTFQTYAKASWTLQKIQGCQRYTSGISGIFWCPPSQLLPAPSPLTLTHKLAPSDFVVNDQHGDEKARVQGIQEGEEEEVYHCNTTRHTNKAHTHTQIRHTHTHTHTAGTAMHANTWRACTCAYIDCACCLK